ncbi:MAG: insulinase family protein [Planctomycetales bacterium]|nr:insulinase family protein [Planctomycetales bacterium]NIM09941.1 insulinase family protein [Planctomycetales bacterium]NIN09381.1 insulinase family protein [Planctomycetales bacterium]NIN78488.1 insulinase family protein [Planctomycetales bacterium]NIO35680.1 insulinase family protein [Planctomycetales bacterium]
MTLVAEPMMWLESVAFTFLVPVGAVYDTAERSGLSNLTCEMALRGCGGRDSREFIQALEELGVEGGESVGVSHTNLRGATLAKNLGPALAIYADLLRDATLPELELEQGRHVAVQELRSVEDDPAHKVMMELRRSHYPQPWGQPHQGDMPGLTTITIDEIRAQYRSGYRPNGTILGVAGRFDWDPLRQTVDRLLGDWEATDRCEPKTGRLHSVQKHLHHQSNQTQIGIAFPSVPYSHPDYFQAWGAVGVLSDGSSSRLFREVREKRGLCYAVSASTRSLKRLGSVFGYAGTTSNRAQETLNVMLEEMQKLGDGIEIVELNRLKARMKSSLIMAQESSLARSGAIARDWYYLERVRTLDEIGRLVDELTPDSINAYLTDNRPSRFTVVTLGPHPLEIPREISSATT